MSYLVIVLTLWATVRMVHSLNWLCTRLVILVSVFTSIAEVASSRINSLEFLVKIGDEYFSFLLSIPT